MMLTYLTMGKEQRTMMVRMIMSATPVGFAAPTTTAILRIYPRMF
jgi:hypothetical protein